MLEVLFFFARVLVGRSLGPGENSIDEYSRAVGRGAKRVGDFFDPRSVPPPRAPQMHPPAMPSHPDAPFDTSQPLAPYEYWQGDRPDWQQ